MNEQTALEYRRRICRAMNYISENLEQELTLDDIARASSFSKFHFHRIFKAVTGETVSAFVRRLRLEWAANRLLGELRRDITSIALDCGFSSSQNFAKAFRQHFGMSPTGFRLSKRGTASRKAGTTAGKRVNAMSLRVHYDEDTMNTMTMNQRRLGMNVEIKQLPDFHVAYVRKLGAYGKETCEQAFGELMQWAGSRGLAAKGTMLGVYWDNPEVTPPEKCRVDACLTVPPGTKTSGQVGVQTLGGGLYAICGFEIRGESFQGAWDEVFQWLVASGRECEDKPCFEMYHASPDEHPEGKWKFDICVPLKE
ncbi:AraC family transcriptional regulator [bacterium]|nr:AraC family transcriptional regulator [candidate division CSSED10-310 bacterium]